MAVPTTALAIRYVGNGSTETPYAIPFPFLDAAHIYISAAQEEIAIGTLTNSVVVPGEDTLWTYDPGIALQLQVGWVVVDEAGNRGTVTTAAFDTDFTTSEDDPFNPGVGEIITVLTPSVMPQGNYTVTRLPDGSGGSLVTAEPITSPDELVIFRQVPLTQPTAFQPAGPLPAKSIETVGDRLLMQIQQLNRRLNALEGIDDDDYIYVPGANSNAAQGIIVWETVSERASAKPTYKGQLGVETGTQTVWIAQSATVGHWAEYAGKFTNQVVIGLAADAGEPGEYQTSAAETFTAWEVDAVLFAGDNNYNGPDEYDNDWAAFDAFVNDGRAFPALGNHDVDFDGWEDRHASKFPYLPGNGRYYTVTLGGGLVDLFVLNSGRNSLFDLLEEDGNSVGSAQHAWFVEALASSKARWKIAMFHHPPVSMTDDTESRIEPEMAWPELAQCDLVCCGHTHLSEILKWNGTQLVNLSGMAFINGTPGATVQGGSATDAGLWVSDDYHTIGRIVASQEKLTVEVWAIGVTYIGSRLLHVRDARDFSRPSPVVDTFTIYPPETILPSDETSYVCTIPAPSILLSAEARTTTTDGYEVFWHVNAGDVGIANGTIPDDEPRSVGEAYFDQIIPQGSVITVDVGAIGVRYGLELSLTFQRLN